MSWDELKHNAAPPQPDAHPDVPSTEAPSGRSTQDPIFGYYCTGTVKPARVAFGNNMIPKGALVEIDVIAVCPQN